MKRSKFNLSHTWLTTADMGNLVPIGLVEALPGDTIQMQSNVLIRLSPMAAPVMHPVAARIHHFFVPHRLAWGDECGKAWEKFITGGPDGTDASTIPTVNTSGVTGDLFDLYGLPAKVAGIPVSALPFRGYNLIWNEWYRDQDLATERVTDDTSIAQIAWEKDYFTTARPWAQRGPEITLPISGQARVKVDGTIGGNVGLEAAGVDRLLGSDSASTGGILQVNNAITVPGTGQEMYADLAGATAVNINQLREAFALQRFAEARARYGARYTEYLRYLGVSAQDSRLDRPEYLGGGVARVAISEVLQTANEATPSRFGVGDLYGHGVTGIRANRFRRYIPEHGYVHSFLSVRPKTIYTDNIPRTFLRKDREDFWQKELEFIGQQAIWNNEVFSVSGDDRSVWGYQDRYREYREQQSRVCGEFRTDLNYWHLGRVFESRPALNETFVRCTPTKRVFNVQDRNVLWVMCQNRIVARRPVSRSAAAKII